MKLECSLSGSKADIICCAAKVSYDPKHDIGAAYTAAAMAAAVSNFPWHSSLLRQLLDVVADDYIRDRGGNYLSGVDHDVGYWGHGTRFRSRNHGR